MLTLLPGLAGCAFPEDMPRVAYRRQLDQGREIVLYRPMGGEVSLAYEFVVRTKNRALASAILGYWELGGAKNWPDFQVSTHDAVAILCERDCPDLIWLAVDFDKRTVVCPNQEKLLEISLCSI